MESLRKIKPGEWCKIEDGIPPCLVLVYVRLTNGKTGLDLIVDKKGIMQFNSRKGERWKEIIEWSPVAQEVDVFKTDYLLKPFKIKYDTRLPPDFKGK
jgi:hypothetical protein